jgi:hypothetical protein
VNCGPSHVQCNYSTAYSGFNIQMNVSGLLLEISGQLNARYAAKFVPNTARLIQFTLCELWTRDIQCNYRSAYSGFNIQLNVSALILEICRQFNVRYTANMVPIQRTFFSLRYLNCGSRHVQCNYSSAYSGFNIQLNVSLPLFEISWQFNVSNNANLVPITAHFLQLTLCGLWSWRYTKYLQLRIFRLQYSAVGICAAIGDISTIQWAL